MRTLLTLLALLVSGCQESKDLQGPLPITGDYSYAEIKTFLDTVFVGDAGARGGGIVVKWDHILLEPRGHPGTGDLSTISKVVDDFNCSAGRRLAEIVQSEGTLKLHIVPRENFHLYFDFAINPTLAGLADLHYSGGEVVSGVLAVSEELSDELRSGVMRHELMHGIGFTGHSKHPLSAIRNGSRNYWLTAIDQTMIEMLYHPGMRPGMDRDEAYEVLRTMRRPLRNCGATVDPAG